MSKSRPFPPQAVIESPLPSDATVQSQAQQMLESSNYLALRRLRCECHDGRLVISGRVPTYYLKQLAQSIVRQVAHLRRIDNQVDVAEFWN
jgi:hypothetical protein